MKKKRRKLSKVKLVKEMSRERTPVPSTRRIENKKQKTFDKELTAYLKRMNVLSEE